MTNPTITPFPAVSSWGRRDGMWCDESGEPHPRDWWEQRYAGAGRPPCVPRDRWDEAAEARVAWNWGAITTLEFIRRFDVSRRCANKFLSYEVLWWL